MTPDELDILYEDNHLLGVVKSPGMLSQAAGDSTKGEVLPEMVKAYLKTKYDKAGNVFLGIVHRLDRPVGGAMVFARTSKAAARLSEQVRRRSFSKTYLAVLDGVPQAAEERLVDWLVKDAGTNTTRVVAAGTPGAKQSALDYRVLETSEGGSLVQVELETGRPHQIRVQFASRNLPLVGDRRYGTPAAIAKSATVALWCWRLAFEHPTKRQAILLECAPPVSVEPWSRFTDYG